MQWTSSQVRRRPKKSSCCSAAHEGNDLRTSHRRRRVFGWPSLAPSMFIPHVAALVTRKPSTATAFFLYTAACLTLTKCRRARRQQAESDSSPAVLSCRAAVGQAVNTNSISVAQCEIASRQALSCLHHLSFAGGSE